MRPRFKRSALYSSAGRHVKQSHIAYIKEKHEENRELIQKISIEITITPKRHYYVKCGGKLILITEREALMLSPSLVIKK